MWCRLLETIIKLSSQINILKIFSFLNAYGILKMGFVSKARKRNRDISFMLQQFHGGKKIKFTKIINTKFESKFSKLLKQCCGKNSKFLYIQINNKKEGVL